MRSQLRSEWQRMVGLALVSLVYDCCMGRGAHVHEGLCGQEHALVLCPAGGCPLRSGPGLRLLLLQRQRQGEELRYVSECLACERLSTM
jgi:hypothetical protein